MRLIKFLKWPILGGAGFLLLSILILTGIRFFTSAPAKADCEIYKALTTEILDSKSGHVEVFRPYIVALNDPDFEEKFSLVTTVIHRTNQKETVPAGDGYDSYEVFLTEKVDVDLSDINWTPPPTERKSFGKCYKTESRPTISSLNLEALALRESVKHGSTDSWPNIWQFAGVVKSDDELNAIVFANSYCGGLCAWGGFYFLEKTDERWHIIGYHTEWVS